MTDELIDNILISYDPSSGEVVGTVQKTSDEEIAEKVQIAKKPRNYGLDLQ